MAIAEGQAVAAAQAFVVARGHAPLDEAEMRVEQGATDGKSVWIVHAPDVLPEGEPAWMHPDRRVVSYFVEAESGRVIGFQVGASRTILDGA